MRLAYILRVSEDLPHGGPGLLIGPHAACEVSEIPSLYLEELLNARPVVRAADVHGVGEGRNGLMRIPDAGSEVAGNGVVDVGGDDEALYAKAQGLCDEACGNVAEVAARDREDNRLSLLGRERRDCLKIVADLGEQAADVDGVCGVEADSGPDLLVIKRLLHKGLAVIEGAAHGDSPDVAAQSAEQLLLQRAYLALRIEHADVDVLKAEEGMGNSGAGVS